MKKTFYSNGKLLITSEYVVLEGAIALALPTKFGQSLHIDEGGNQQFHWRSYDADQSIWFEDVISFSSIKEKERFEEGESIKNRLIEILHEAYKMNSNFILNSNGYKVTTELSFPKKWGLGTSSTLINNIANWLKIDAFELLQKSFGGSGYDIACAQNNSAIIYQLIEEKPLVKNVHFDPAFSENIYFVYLNRKQNSRDAVTNYFNNGGSLKKEISNFNGITEAVVESKSLEIFSDLLETHEILLSKILKRSTVKELYFYDFKGTIKSLGAWGGDFIMVTSKDDPTAYFKSKGYDTIITYKDMIL
ncbi:GYDIA family GHMP kinase [Flavobacterium sp.]